MTSLINVVNLATPVYIGEALEVKSCTVEPGLMAEQGAWRSFGQRSGRQLLSD
jgi:hypothetical protein